MQDLWRWPEICDAVHAKDADGPSVSALGFDSRKIEVGQLFIALKSNDQETLAGDGHNFVEAAAKAGAVGAIVNDSFHKECSIPTIKVPDSFKALYDLAGRARDRIQGSVVAVTGSSGKTTFKEFLAKIVGGYCSAASFNNEIGVPISLVNADLSKKAFVFEVGTNHPGEIGPLTSLIKPEFSVLLNVQDAHIGNFRDSRELLNEKLQIFTTLQNNQSRISHDELGLKGHQFGYKEGSDAQLISVNENHCLINLLGRLVKVEMPVGGVHNALTMAAALLTSELLGKKVEDHLILPADSHPRGRGNKSYVKGIEVIDDSYNANPTSMMASLRTQLDRGTSGKNVAVIGEMLELGDESVQKHKEILQMLRNFDRVFLVGDVFSPLIAENDKKSFSVYSTADENLAREIRSEINEGDTILVKGSNKIFWSHNFVAELCRRLEV